MRGHCMNRSIRPSAPLLGFVAGVLAWVTPVSAQDNYPSRNIRLIVSFPPGGGIDAVARLFADKMTAILGQPIVVENRGGAAGLLAGRPAPAAAADRYTALVSRNSMILPPLIKPTPGPRIDG